MTHQIALEGMRFYAYLGFYEEERIIGNYFEVDVYILTNFNKASVDDDLYQTINYETVYLICQKEMMVKSKGEDEEKPKLLETVAARILNALKFQFDNLHEVTIRIKKENPMPGVKVANSQVELSGSFLKKCPRCGSPLICYKDGNCSCHSIKIHPQTLTMLNQKYSGCLCRNCLKYYAG